MPDDDEASLGPRSDLALRRAAARREVDALAWELVGRLTASMPWHAEPEVQIALDRGSPKV